MIDHEIAIAVTAGLIMLATFDGANQFGLWTFAVLWVMRISAKLNVFLGAPNVPTEFLPDHLAYLKSYFRRRAMNGLFPPAITAASLATAFLAHMAIFAPDDFRAVGFTLLTTMMALAVLEHWLLFIPLQASALWSWGLKAHERTREHVRRAREGHLSSWTLALAAPCSANRIDAVLNGVAQGRFGDVRSLDGAAASRDGWLTFKVADGRAFIDKAPSSAAVEARVTAIGRNLDEKRLSAAFLACAA